MSYRSFILLGILINILPSCTNKKGLPESKAFEYVVTYYSDSTIKEIVQKRNGQLSGKAFKFNEDGTKLWEFNYVDNKREGLQYTYDSRGKLIWTETYKNDQLNGWAKHFTGPCEILSEEGQYDDGKMNGLWYEYYGKELLEIDFFSNDSLVKIVHRNKKYSDRNASLPSIPEDCYEAHRKQ